MSTEDPTGIELRRLCAGDEARYRLAASRVADGAPAPAQVARRGIAKALLSLAREAALEQHCYEMWVLTDPDNEAAHALYRSAGGELDEPQSMFVFPLRVAAESGATS